MPNPTNSQARTPTVPRTLKDLFPSRFLTAADLPRPVVATIARILFEDLTGRDGTQTKAVVYFQRAQKALVLNKTQATALADLAGSEEISAWLGLTVQLAPGRAQNGKDTIVINRAPARPGAPTAARQPDPDDDEARADAEYQEFIRQHPEADPNGPDVPDPDDAGADFDSLPSASAGRR